MAKLRWLYWGIFFSVVLFVVIYLLIYKKVVDNPGAVLMLGNKDISGISGFFSKIGNVVLSSLGLGFLLGITTLIGQRKNRI